MIGDRTYSSREMVAFTNDHNEWSWYLGIFYRYNKGH